MSNVHCSESSLREDEDTPEAFSDLPSGLVVVSGGSGPLVYGHVHGNTT